MLFHSFISKIQILKFIFWTPPKSPNFEFQIFHRCLRRVNGVTDIKLRKVTEISSDIGLHFAIFWSVVPLKPLNYDVLRKEGERVYKDEIISWTFYFISSYKQRWLLGPLRRNWQMQMDFLRLQVLGVLFVWRLPKDWRRFMWLMHQQPVWV